MSLFTKRRKKVRIKQEEQHKHWEETSKRQNESFKKMIEVMKIIETKYLDYEQLSTDERVKIYREEYEKYCEEN